MQTVKTKMTLREARLFLIRNNKAAAIANRTWPRIKARWDEAQAIVLEEERRFRTIMPSKPERVYTDAEKEKVKEAMKPVALRMVGNKRGVGRVTWQRTRVSATVGIAED